jgi:hypothetical protein
VVEELIHAEPAVVEVECSTGSSGLSTTPPT